MKPHPTWPNTWFTERSDMKAPFVRNPYNYDTTKASDEAGEKNTEPSMTKQSFAEEADINTIVKRFHLTGELPNNVRMPTYGDFTDVPTFQDAMNAIRTATESFNAMPADIRAKFHNDPAEFVAFCDDPENYDQAKKWGLVNPNKTEPPAPGPLPGSIPEDAPGGATATAKPLGKGADEDSGAAQPAATSRKQK